MAVNVITATTPMTKGQEASLRDFGVSPGGWTWLYASCRIDMLQGTPIPGTTAEAWLRDHGATPQQATALVTQSLIDEGHNFETLLRTATAEHRAIADRQVARLVMDTQHQGRAYTEREIADFRARAVLRQLMAAKEHTDEGEATATRLARPSETRGRGLPRTI
jgi:hypothetical protein